MSNVPNHVTHQPVQVVVPSDDDTMVERGPSHTPSLWQTGVQVTHKASRRTGIVRCVDWKTNQFRLVGESRTSWQHCSEWDVLVEPTVAERQKDEAREQLAAEIAELDADMLSLVEVLCDDADPAKALGKLRAMRRAGMLGEAPAPAPKRDRKAKAGK